MEFKHVKLLHSVWNVAKIVSFKDFVKTNTEGKETGVDLFN